MKKVLFIFWILIGAGIALWHYGPGQSGWQRDKAARAVEKGQELRESGNATAAVSAYEDALSLLPPEDLDGRAKARIGLAQAQMEAQGLPQARADMEELLSELPPSTDPQILAAARVTLAETQYYNTWLMRLEGAPREEWEPEIESARQLLRDNVENFPQSDADKQKAQRNLEATIRLARMELTDLQGLPIPSQCKGCKSCQGKKPGKKGQKPKATKEDVRSAGGSIEIDRAGD